MAMRKLMISTASIIGLASSVEAAKIKMPDGTVKHTWYQLNYDTATCEVSDKTPEEFQSFVGGPVGHSQGLTAEIITPDDVYKDAYGNVIVTVRTDKDGKAYWRFYTSKDSCQLTAKTLTPVQAPSGDIN
jgi:hypothetical protein